MISFDEEIPSLATRFWIIKLVLIKLMPCFASSATVSLHTKHSSLSAPGETLFDKHCWQNVWRHGSVFGMCSALVSDDESYMTMHISQDNPSMRPSISQDNPSMRPAVRRSAAVDVDVDVDVDEAIFAIFFDISYSLISKLL